LFFYQTSSDNVDIVKLDIFKFDVRLLHLKE